MKSFKLYMHTNKINGKKYIGVTCQESDRRWRNGGKGYNCSRYFYAAIQKYGWDNFESVILESELTKEEAEEKEKLLIKIHNTTNREKGYNISNGGCLAGKHSEETRKIMSEKAKKRKVNPKAIQKMREANKNRVATDEQRANISKALKGRKLSPKHIESIRWSHIGYKMPKEQKKKISLALREHYKDENNIKKRSDVSKLLYSDPALRKKISLIRMKINKPIILTNTGERFENHVEAGNIYNVQNNKILRNCQRKNYSAGKDKCNKPLIWVFESDYEEGFDYLFHYKKRISEIKTKANNSRYNN